MHAFQVPQGNFSLQKTKVKMSGLWATSFNSIHIGVTQSAPNDSSNAEEEDIGQVGTAPGDASVSNHSHSRHPLTWWMTLQ